LLRILQHKSHKTPNIELYKTYSTLPVHLLHNFQILIFMHKYVYHREQLPSVFSSYFEENTLIHHHNTGTREKHQFHISSVSSEYGKRTIKYKGIKLWNNLSVDIKETKSLQSFKHKIQEFILQFWV